MSVGKQGLQAGKAILIAIGGTGIGGQRRAIPGVYEDVRKLRQYLLEKGLQADSIIILTDEEGTPDDQLPTHDNIIKKLQDFVQDTDADGTNYFFFYAGHGGQEPSPVAYMKFEKDGQSEYIHLPDAAEGQNRIWDQELYELIVEPLTRKIKATGTLFAIIDSCHSATMLNLPHTDCNVWSIDSLIKRARRKVTESAHTLVHKHDEYDEKAVMHRTWRQALQRTAAPENKFCNGNCCRVKGPRILCLSSCRDDELTYDTTKAPSMTHTLVDYLNKTDSNPKLRTLMAHLSEVCEKKMIAHKLSMEGAVKEFQDIFANVPCWPDQSTLADVAVEDHLTAVEAHSTVTTEDYQKALNMLQSNTGQIFHPQLSSYVPANMKERLFRDE